MSFLIGLGTGLFKQAAKQITARTQRMQELWDQKAQRYLAQVDRETAQRAETRQLIEANAKNFLWRNIYIS